MMTVRLFVAAALVGGVAAGAASAGDLIAIASFEEPPVFKGVQYTDTGDASQDHQLFNNPEEPWVEHTDPINELGFLAFYENTRDGVGLTDGDFVGVTDFVGAVGQYTDGFQGYQMGDPDGLMRVELDEVDLSGVGSAMLSVDYFLQETGWEEDDRIRIWVVLDDGTEIDVFNTEGMDIDDLESEGFWITGMANLSGAASAQLKAELDSNSGSETVYLDNIRFTGIAGNEIVVCPEAFERVRGLPVSGDLGSLCDSDDDRLATRPDVFAPAPLDDPAVQVELTATVAQTSPSQISFTVESSATVDSAIRQNILLFNFAAGEYDLVDQRVIGTSDGEVVVTIDANPGDYINQSTGEVRALVQHVGLLFSLSPTWNAGLDRTVWTVIE